MKKNLALFLLLLVSLTGFAQRRVNLPSDVKVGDSSDRPLDNYARQVWIDGKLNYRIGNGPLMSPAQFLAGITSGVKSYTALDDRPTIPTSASQVGAVPITRKIKVNGVQYPLDQDPDITVGTSSGGSSVTITQGPGILITGPPNSITVTAVQPSLFFKNYFKGTGADTLNAINLDSIFATKEKALGNPSVNGYVLSSTIGGVRTWVPQSAGGGGGTVTSVAVAVPPGLTVSGSPVTGSGTITVGTNLNGIVKGDGVGFNTVIAPSGALVGTTDTQTLTNKTVNGVTPSTFAFLDPTSSVQGQLNGKQPLDADLTTIAGITPTNDNFLQVKSGAWASRTIAQVKTDLGVSGTNTGDQTLAISGNTLSISGGNSVTLPSSSGGSSNTIASPLTLTNTANPASSDNDPFVAETIQDPQNTAITAFRFRMMSSASRRGYFGSPSQPIYALNFGNVGQFEAVPGFAFASGLSLGLDNAIAITRSGNGILLHASGSSTATVDFSTNTTTFDNSVGSASSRKMRLTGSGSLLVMNGGNDGSGFSEVTTSQFTVGGTTKGSIPFPRLTTTQRDAISSPAAGLFIYNTTTNALNFYNGSVWKVMTNN